MVSQREVRWAEAEEQGPPRDRRSMRGWLWDKGSARAGQEYSEWLDCCQCVMVWHEWMSGLAWAEKLPMTLCCLIQALKFVKVANLCRGLSLCTALAGPMRGLC